jgi:hypothetical protein
VWGAVVFLFLGGGALPANQIKLGKLNFRFSIESRQYPTEMRNAAEYIGGGGEDNVVSIYTEGRLTLSRNVRISLFLFGASRLGIDKERKETDARLLAGKCMMQLYSKLF